MFGLEVESINTFETSEATHPKTQRHLPEERNPHYSSAKYELTLVQIRSTHIKVIDVFRIHGRRNTSASFNQSGYCIVHSVVAQTYVCISPRNAGFLWSSDFIFSTYRIFLYSYLHNKPLVPNTYQFLSQNSRFLLLFSYKLTYGNTAKPTFPFVSSFTYVFTNISCVVDFITNILAVIFYPFTNSTLKPHIHTTLIIFSKLLKYLKHTNHAHWFSLISYSGTGFCYLPIVTYSYSYSQLPSD